MRFPWKRRADLAHVERVEAEHRLEEVQADWSKVNAEVAVTHRERELNGWTATVMTLFSGRT
jgi:hypothetical protein